MIDNNELYHHGVKGMKWGHRKKTYSTSGGISGAIRRKQISNARNDLAKTKSRQKQVNNELKELRSYEKNPSGLGKSKASTAIRRNQIKSLERTNAKLSTRAQDNKSALKELKGIEKYQSEKKAAKKERKTAIKSTYKDINKKASLGEKLTYNNATRKKAAKYVVDNNMTVSEANKKAKGDTWRNTAAFMAAYGGAVAVGSYVVKKKLG